MKRNYAVLALALALIVLPVAAFVGRDLLAQIAPIVFNPGTTSLNSGDSVVGDELLMCGLVVSDSDGNLVNYIEEGQAPHAYGGGNGVNALNTCMPNDWAIADTAQPVNNRNHDYEFSFTDGSTVNSFSARMLDWGDFMGYGDCPGLHCSVEMTAYDSSNNVIDQEEMFFTLSSAGQGTAKRNTVEYGNTGTSGDACDATFGQPGNFILTVGGTGISRITFNFPNQGSTDPNIAITDITYTFEEGTEGAYNCAGAPRPTSSPSPVTPPVNPGPTDVCANIDGVQTSVPGDLHLDASGLNCVAFQFGGPGNGGGNSGGGQVLGTSTTSGKTGSVLGASTLANTGEVVANLISLTFATGASLLGLGVKRYFSTSK